MARDNSRQQNIDKPLIYIGIIDSQDVPQGPNWTGPTRLLIRRSLVRAQVGEPRKPNENKALQ